MTRYLARSVATLALVLAFTAGYCGLTTVLQDLAYTRAQTELSFWGRGDYQPSGQAVGETARTLRTLLGKAPLHPEFLILQARYYAWQAYWSDNMQSRADFSREAMASQYRALESRPAHRHSWTTMVEYASRASDGNAMREFALTRLTMLQPRKKPEGVMQEQTR